MAAGKVTTGFSYPFIALYSANEGSITYSSGMELARGVDVDIQPESSGDNKFYANNAVAEEEPIRFIKGTLALTVDGLFAAAKKLMLGLPAAGTDGGTNYGDEMNVPYVGFGYLSEAQSEGVVKYYPTVLYKVKFKIPNNGAATREESISWQTQALSADIFRSDDSQHNWKWEHDTGFTDETEALNTLKSKLNIATA